MLNILFHRSGLVREGVRPPRHPNKRIQELPGNTPPVPLGYDGEKTGESRPDETSDRLEGDARFQGTEGIAQPEKVKSEQRKIRFFQRTKPRKGIRGYPGKNRKAEGGLKLDEPKEKEGPDQKLGGTQQGIPGTTGAKPEPKEDPTPGRARPTHQEENRKPQPRLRKPHPLTGAKKANPPKSQGEEIKTSREKFPDFFFSFFVVGLRWF
ncbi:hypothetical protein K1719_017497 [Acacia pycnantha]|nr:hypothetical protein K1719_017497 [Acacia pycnantha]